MVAYYIEIFCKVGCIVMLLFQGLLLDAYLVKFYGNYHWCWVITDAFIILIWVVTLILAKRNFEGRKNKSDENDGRNPEEYPDEIKYAFIAWISYALLLSPRVVILFHRNASKLKEENILGPNFLKVAVSTTPLIFLFLVGGYHSSKPHSRRKYYIASLIGFVCLDLFDSIDLLDFLFIPDEERNFPQLYLDVSLALSIINFFLPTLALTEIYVNGFSGRLASLSFKMLYVSGYVFMINVPNLIIRSILWHTYDRDVSVLIMKNVMCIAIGISEIAEYFGDDKPLKCSKCGGWWSRSSFEGHKARCHLNERSRLYEDGSL